MKVRPHVKLEMLFFGKTQQPSLKVSAGIYEGEKNSRTGFDDERADLRTMCSQVESLRVGPERRSLFHLVFAICGDYTCATFVTCGCYVWEPQYVHNIVKRRRRDDEKNGYTNKCWATARRSFAFESDRSGRQIICRWVDYSILPRSLQRRKMINV